MLRKAFKTAVWSNRLHDTPLILNKFSLYTRRVFLYNLLKIFQKSITHRYAVLYL
ncbi:hypothetical protein CLOSTHATH_01981 [Hungatella hathewayi DSM 13479]|uniref:Uncharacterized protein n=1 Tax=Hungatella hathewayi DSM 13479 TaxID=566550 RepID=D3AEF0_9FIRM|nr:hypothetical protein CLOSTHATH_01981 [Hungatella hathewayi DSM 13479]